jgi:hypothetical protein
MFDNIRHLRPYFFSLREIDNNVSLDIKLPVTWKIESIISLYKSINDLLCFLNQYVPRLK